MVLIKHLPPVICSIIVGYLVFLILDMPGRVLLAVSFSAIFFLLYEVLFLNSLRLNFNWSYRNNYSLKESWKIVLILIFLGVFVILVLIESQKASIVYQPWFDISVISWVRFIVTLPLVFFFPGYIILKILDRKIELNKLESFTISPLLSFLVVSLVGFVLITTSMNISSSGVDAFLVFYVVLLVLYFVNSWVRKGKNVDAATKKPSIKLYVALILLLVIISLLILVYAIQSSGIIPGDERSFLGLSVGLENIFPVNNGTIGPYPYWASLSTAFFFVLSGFPVANSFTILHFLTTIPTLCFFLLAMSFFKKNQHTAIVATIMYTFCAGFGWVYTMMLRASSNLSLAQAIEYSSDKTYDISNIASQFSFTLDAPELLGFSCFLLAIYLVGRQWRSNLTPYVLMFALISQVLVNFFFSREQLIPKK